MAFERVHVSGPEPTERSQPGIQFLQWFRFQAVEPALCVHRGFHETGVAQHAQVLGHGRLRHTELALDLPNRLFRRDQEAQYRAAVRLRDDFEDRFHPVDIPHGAYACQGIYTVDAKTQKRPPERVAVFVVVEVNLVDRYLMIRRLLGGAGASVPPVPPAW